MITLGIDYGRSKIGIALAQGSFAEPLKVIHADSFDKAAEEIKKVVEQEKVDQIVVGVSEGEMGEASKEFSTALGQSLNISVETSDETLTTQDAQRLAIEAGLPQKKRHGMEDAYAASILLQNYLDQKKS